MADKLPAALKRLRHDRAGEPFDLARVDPAAKPFSTGDKRKDKAAVEALAVELDRLQDVLFASRTRKLLVSCRAWTRAARTARCAACSTA